MIKKIIQPILVIVLLFSFIFLIINMLPSNSKLELSNSNTTIPEISSEVEQYIPLVKKYANIYGVSEYIDVLMAMIMQESSGRGNDPMQSSESYCGVKDCITNPEQSIQQGVFYFSETLNASGGDVELAVQSYNFGKGFISYVKSQSSGYTQDIAINFSKKMYEESPNKEIYSCLREEAKQYNACYGDIYYVDSVMAYRNAFKE